MSSEKKIFDRKDAKMQAEYTVEIKGVNPTKPLILPISPDQIYHNNGEFSATLKHIRDNKLNVILVIAERTLTLQMDGKHTPEAAQVESETLQRDWINKNLMIDNKEIFEELKKNQKIQVYTIAEFDKHCKNEYQEKYHSDFDANTNVQEAYNKPCAFLLKSGMSKSSIGESPVNLFPHQSGSAYILTDSECFYVEDIKNHAKLTEKDRISDSAATIQKLKEIYPTSDLAAIESILKHKHNTFKRAVGEAKDNFCENAAAKNQANPSFKPKDAQELSEKYILNEIDSMHLWDSVGYEQMGYPINANKTNQKVFNCVKALGMGTKKDTESANGPGMQLLNLSITKNKKAAENIQTKKSSPRQFESKETNVILGSSPPRFSPPPSPTKKTNLSPPPPPNSLEGSGMYDIGSPVFTSAVVLDLAMTKLLSTIAQNPNADPEVIHKQAEALSIFARSWAETPFQQTTPGIQLFQQPPQPKEKNIMPTILITSPSPISNSSD